MGHQGYFWWPAHRKYWQNLIKAICIKDEYFTFITFFRDSRWAIYSPNCIKNWYWIELLFVGGYWPLQRLIFKGIQIELHSLSDNYQDIWNRALHNERGMIFWEASFMILKAKWKIHGWSLCIFIRNISFIEMPVSLLNGLYSKFCGYIHTWEAVLNFKSALSLYFLLYNFLVPPFPAKELYSSSHYSEMLGVD